MAKTNDKQKWIWAIIVVLALALVIIFTRSADNGSDIRLNCVSAPTCHPTTCVPEREYVPNPDLLCTQECQPGTLDCGQGSCQEVEGKCQAVLL